MSDPTGVRSRKKERTRRAIERAVLDLIEAQGLDGTTIEDIAAAADIAPRTFWHYFGSKEEAVLADYTVRLDRILAVLEVAPPGQPPWSALRQAFLAVGADYETEREELLRRFRIIQSTPSVAAQNLLVQAGWEDAVSEAVSKRLIPDDPDDVRPRLIAGAALAAMRASLRRWLADDGRSRLPDHIARCFDLLEDGLGGIGREGR